MKAVVDTSLPLARVMLVTFWPVVVKPLPVVLTWVYEGVLDLTATGVYWYKPEGAAWGLLWYWIVALAFPAVAVWVR